MNVIRKYYNLDQIMVRKGGHKDTEIISFLLSGIQFNVLLSPYLCFVSVLYLDYMFLEMMHWQARVFHADQT